MFDGSNSKRIDYLDSERKLLWDRFLDLEKRFEEKPSDLEKEAKQASRKTAEYRNKAEARLNEANDILERMTSKELALNDKVEYISVIENEIDEKKQNLYKSSDSIEKRSESLLDLLNKINNILEEYPDFESEIEKLDNNLTSIQENASKSSSTYKGILAKKSDIDELHREIIGYEDEDEMGEVVSVEGLKHELTSSFDELDQTSSDLKNELESLTSYSKNQFDNFINNYQSEINDAKRKSNKEYN
ncbi:MAG: hypothetical protein WBA74_06575, partial [Cyclobacteriaceae bacterium]